MTEPRRRLKAYPSDDLIVIPDAWKLALQIPHHHTQANVLAFAERKDPTSKGGASVHGLLADRINYILACTLVKKLRYRTGGLNYTEEAALEAGIIDPYRPGVYAYADQSPRLIIEILPGGECKVIGEFRYDHAEHKTIAEPAP